MVKIDAFGVRAPLAHRQHQNQSTVGMRTSKCVPDNSKAIINRRGAFRRKTWGRRREAQLLLLDSWSHPCLMLPQSTDIPSKERQPSSRTDALTSSPIKQAWVTSPQIKTCKASTPLPPGPHPLDRGIEVVKRLLRYDGRYVGPNAILRPPFLNGHQPVRLDDGVDDRAVVQGTQRAQVDHLSVQTERFHRNVFLWEFQRGRLTQAGAAPRIQTFKTCKTQELSYVGDLEYRSEICP